MRLASGNLLSLGAPPALTEIYTFTPLPMVRPHSNSLVPVQLPVTLCHPRYIPYRR